MERTPQEHAVRDHQTKYRLILEKNIQDKCLKFLELKRGLKKEKASLFFPAVGREACIAIKSDVASAGTVVWHFCWVVKRK